VAETDVTPFRIEVPQADVDDLVERLKRTRWPVGQDLPGERGIPVDLVSWTEFERGGHFAAMEVPDLLVEELRRFVRAVAR
jgi:epoxide hydrolase-like protein